MLKYSYTHYTAPQSYVKSHGVSQDPSRQFSFEKNPVMQSLTTVRSGDVELCNPIFKAADWLSGVR